MEPLHFHNSIKNNICQASCVIIGFIFGHLVIIQIDFISYNHDPDVCAGLLVKLLDPLLALFERVSTSNIKYNTCSDSILVIHLCKGSISLLTSHVPHFVLDDVISEVLIPGEEAPSNSGLMSIFGIVF